MFKKILSRIIYGGSSRLLPFEQSCIDAIVERLPESIIPILRENASAPDCKQRWSNGRIVKFDYLDVTDADRVPLFPNREKECRLARLELESTNGPAIRCDAMLAVGRLATLEFSRDPKYIKKPVVIRRVVISKSALEERATSALSTITPSPELEQLFSGSRVSEVRPPATDRELGQLEESLSERLPDDLRQLMLLSSGFNVGNWTFHGVSASRIPLGNGWFWIFASASDSGQHLGFVEGSNNRHVFHYNTIDEECVPIDLGFVQKLGQLATGI